jgi:hypothetical protein
MTQNGFGLLADGDRVGGINVDSRRRGSYG